MYLDLISDFVAFLGHKEHSGEEVLEYLAKNTFTNLKCRSIFISELATDGTITVTTKYGFKDDFFQKHPHVIRITDKIPMVDAIKNRQTVWITTLPDWGDEYPHLTEIGYNYDSKTMIVWPIEQSGVPCAGIGVFCDADLSPDAELDSFLKGTGNLLALYLFNPKLKLGRTSPRLAVDLESACKELSERQLLILKLMSEGKTNNSISEMLGYSESTIRQETIKIYSKLGCEGRQEASRIYREVLAKK